MDYVFEAAKRSVICTDHPGGDLKKRSTTRPEYSGPELNWLAWAPRVQHPRSRSVAPVNDGSSVISALHTERSMLIRAFSLFIIRPTGSFPPIKMRKSHGHPDPVPYGRPLLSASLQDPHSDSHGPLTLRVLRGRVIGRIPIKDSAMPKSKLCLKAPTAIMRDQSNLFTMFLSPSSDSAEKKRVYRSTSFIR